jgi:DinB family protein
MTGSLAVRRTDASPAPDLRRAPLAAVQGIDFRAATRDFWADEAALWDRLTAAWAGLDDAAWRLPGAAPSDAGGPDWSLLDHVGHVVDWYELAIDYIDDALVGGRWPTDEDYDGGDFDTFNERRRPLFASVPPPDLRARLDAKHAELLASAGRLPLGTIYGDAAWGWVYNVLHGHSIDHLRVLEPWADRLRVRQVQNDPFGPDPQPVAADLSAAKARFWVDEAGVFAHLDEILAGLPLEAWTAAEVTQGWTIADHVGHLASWFDEAVAVLDEHGRTGIWRELPAQGIDAWNDEHVGLARGTSVAEVRERYEAGRERLRRAVAEMADDVWLDPEGFSWAYEDLHGHARCHLAMIAPHIARIGWPGA